MPPPRAAALDSPLQPLSAAELQVAFESVLARFHADPQLPHDALLFPLVALAEPPKAAVLAWKPGAPWHRQAEVQVLHHPSNRAWTAIVELSSHELLQLTAASTGQPPIAGEEYAQAEKLVRAYEPWQRALRARGVDPRYAYLDTWAGGDAALSPAIVAQLPFGRATRIMRCLTFQRDAPGLALADNPYARPVEGLVVVLDMNARRVIDMVDSGARPVIHDSGRGEPSSPLKPLHVTAPEGSELAIEGQRVRFRNWQFYAVMHPREGLVLYDVRFSDHGQLRRVAYRLSLSEIYVPYGIGDANWAWRTAFDVGEYNAGLSAQKMTAGRDVPDNARLLDATFFSDRGPTPENPTGKQDANGVLALFERDAGLLWTRTDPATHQRDSRRARELVAEWNCWIGNYIYVFDWIFKLDGSIEVRVQLHGTTLNRGTTEAPEASAPKVAKDARGVYVAAPHHQHFLSFRLDLDIDGTSNTLMEMEAARLTGAPLKNAFDSVTRQLPSEGYRDADPMHARHWHVESASHKNMFGKPTGYALEPEALAFPYSAPDFEPLARAAFAQHALFFSRYRAEERYASGAFPNQRTHDDGVAAFIEPPEALRGDDVVLWYTTGFTHLARPEDYPVMPMEEIGFRLVPRGFFARNPALDVTDPP